MPRERREGARPPESRSLKQAAASRKIRKWTLQDGTVMEVGPLTVREYFLFENDVGIPLDEFLADVQDHLVAAVQTAQEGGTANVSLTLRSGLMTKLIRVACFVLSVRSELSWEDVSDRVDLTALLTVRDGDLPLLRLLRDAALMPPRVGDEEADESPTKSAAESGAKKPSKPGLMTAPT